MICDPFETPRPDEEGEVSGQEHIRGVLPRLVPFHRDSDRETLACAAVEDNAGAPGNDCHGGI